MISPNHRQPNTRQTLMTIFRSKGLSAQHVMIIGTDNVNLRRTSPLTFFVGLTRARQSLHLITSAQAGGGKTLHPFLLDLPEDSCEYMTYKKTTHSATRVADVSALIGKFEQWERQANRQR